MARAKNNDTVNSNTESDQELTTKEVETSKTKTVKSKETKVTKPRTKKAPTKASTNSTKTSEENLTEETVTEQLVIEQPPVLEVTDSVKTSQESNESSNRAKEKESTGVFVWSIREEKTPKFISKFLDANGKLFGLINPIDLIVILFIFLLGIKVLSDYRPAPLRVKEDQITVGFVIRNIPPYLEQSVTVGQLLFHQDTNALLGKITSKSNKTAEVILQDGVQLVLSRHPQNVDLRLVVTRKGEVITGQSKNGIYLGKLAVRVGDRIKIQTLYSTLEGEVETLDVVSER